MVEFDDVKEEGEEDGEIITEKMFDISTKSVEFLCFC